MPSQALSIFISYASEDVPFAQAIRQRLKDAFQFSIDITEMSQFGLGLNYRDEIDQGLEAADILLIIATGRERPSHSFTGYEVGYFRKSMRGRPWIANQDKVADHDKIDRLIIPFSIFVGTPPVVEMMQGLRINDYFAYEVDAAGQINDPFFKLLDRVYIILNKLNGSPTSLSDQPEVIESFKRQTTQFNQTIRQFMRTLPVEPPRLPTPRITLYLPSDLKAGAVKIDDTVQFSCSGPSNGIFAEEQLAKRVPWTEFARRIGSEKMAPIWNDALRSLVSSILEGNFADTGQVVFSSNESTPYRLFVAETRKYYDGSRQIDIYVVKILHDKDIGDPKTTFLARTIAVTMAYRSRFLEIDGPFCYQAVHQWAMPQEWTRGVSDLLRDLRLLYVQSKEAGVFEPKFVQEMFRDDPKTLANIAQMKIDLEDRMKRLEGTAAEVLATPTKAKFDVFAQTLDEFRELTNAIDTPYLLKILEHLKREVENEKTIRTR
ncbi:MULTISPECIES: toll/interleukin-1 receptor domain-containing protein [unclassified Bradyrhizobium]|uniref:toll/interleukin-1 receptor domain-containing protein n=1 Tax=unclassified Bradyrhizobium TaxID=2631580 RepID=UPI00291665D4|nr:MULTISPECIES: toll/interleukin-1 receptor domain-containing protein [unclassified Bradyrhizobium]